MYTLKKVFWFIYQTGTNINCLMRSILTYLITR